MPLQNLYLLNPLSISHQRQYSDEAIYGFHALWRHGDGARQQMLGLPGYGFCSVRQLRRREWMQDFTADDREGGQRGFS